MFVKHPLIAAASLAIALCVSGGTANAFSGLGCAPTPSPGFTPKMIASYIKTFGADKMEDRACGYYALGILESFTGDDKTAIDAYTRALTIMSNFADAYEMRGDAYAELGMKEEAEADYSRARQSGQDRASDLHSRCWARAIRGVPLDRALVDCNQAMELAHTQAIGSWEHMWDMYDTRCLVHLRMGNDAAAISDCTTALEGNKRLASSLYVRGLAKIQSGDRAGGDADVAAAKEMDYRIDEKYAVFGVKLAQKK